MINNESIISTNAVRWMTMKIDTLKCTGCGLCELACSYRRDKVFTTMRSSIMLHLDDKRNYFGVMVKLPNDDLILGRPEGLDIQRSGESKDEEGTGAKPILLREACDECGDEEPYCVRICPPRCLSVVK
jgi:ferredoxin